MRQKLTGKSACATSEFLPMPRFYGQPKNFLLDWWFQLCDINSSLWEEAFVYDGSPRSRGSSPMHFLRQAADCMCYAVFVCSGEGKGLT